MKFGKRRYIISISNVKTLISFYSWIDLFTWNSVIIFNIFHKRLMINYYLSAPRVWSDNVDETEAMQSFVLLREEK